MAPSFLLDALSVAHLSRRLYLDTWVLWVRQHLISTAAYRLRSFFLDRAPRSHIVALLLCHSLYLTTQVLLLLVQTVLDCTCSHRAIHQTTSIESAAQPAALTSDCLSCLRNPTRVRQKQAGTFRVCLTLGRLVGRKKLLN